MSKNLHLVVDNQPLQLVPIKLMTRVQLIALADRLRISVDRAGPTKAVLSALSDAGVEYRAVNRDEVFTKEPALWIKEGQHE